jgi:hypothetical protein
MARPDDRCWSDPRLLIEAFVTLNLAFLTFDIYLAHSVNQFRSEAEYIPLFFCAAAPILLVVALVLRNRWPTVWKDLGYFVGWLAVLIGLTGVIFHLESRFFYERTLRSLTYSAPFAAPLAFTGLGFLLIMNRMVDSAGVEWSQWVLLFALGGFIGNFVFSLTDHAENGFFYSTEWAPVVASAIAVGFLTVPLAMKVSSQFILLCGVILLFEAMIGVWGFLLHSLGNLQGPSVHPFSNFIYGAPPIAPLLFPNLAVLGLIGLWQLRTSNEPDLR